MSVLSTLGTLAGGPVGGAIGAGISAITSLFGAGQQREAIRNAAAAQQNAATRNAALEQQATDRANQYTEDNLAHIRENEQPYQQAAETALSQLAQGTQAGGQFNSTPTSQQVMAQDPGSDFALQQGELALQRAQAAGGSLASGGALKAATRYGQDYAQTQYNNALQRYMTLRNANYSDLAGLVNYGQNANQVDANATENASGLVSGTTMQGTAAQTNDLSQAANAQAGAYIGQANATNQALGSIGTAAQQYVAQQPALNQSGYAQRTINGAQSNLNVTPTPISYKLPNLSLADLGVLGD